MRKVVWDLIVIVYILIAVFITVCLLAYNDYNVTQFGDKLLVVVKNGNYDDYKKNDLLIIDKDEDYKEDDNVFYYIEKAGNYYINYGSIDKIEKETAIINGEIVDINTVISTDDEVSVISGVGAILSVLESKWGYLCIVIFPILIAFIYEIYEIVKELKKGK